MRRFVTHTLAFVALQLTVLMAVCRVCPSDREDYMAATIDKHARLEQAESPRLIFIGGSSLAFGIDSSAFEGMGLEPVNMGLTQGLGLAYMLAEVRPEMGEGDVVVVMPDPHLYWTGAQNDALWAVLERRPANLACVARSGSDVAKAGLDQALHFFARKVRCAVHGESTDSPKAAFYRRSSFDETGDFVGHSGAPSARNDEIDGPWPPPEQLRLGVSVRALQRFARRCERVGAHCYLGWSPQRRARVSAERDVFEFLYDRLGHDVPLPWLDSYEDHVFPNSAFFDQGPHLRREAATTRSRRLRVRLTSALTQ